MPIEHKPVWLSRAVFLLCMLAPWSLLWLDSSLLFPYETGKAWVFRGIVSLAFPLLVIDRFINPRSYPGRVSWSKGVQLWQYSLLAFLVWSGLSNLWGIDLTRSFWSNYERMGGYLSYLYWAGYFLCLISVLNRSNTRVFLLNILSVIVVICAIGLMEPEKRAIATLGNPIYFGNLAVLGLFIAAFLSAGVRVTSLWKTRFTRALYIGIAVLLLLAIFKSASRGPILALLAGLGIMAASLLLDRFKGMSSRLGIILLAGVFLSTSVYLGFQFGAGQYLRDSDSYALQRIGRISLNNQTTADRLENWRIAIDAAGQYPVSGWGQENYAIAFNEHYRAGVMDKAKIWFDRAHNAYLDVLLASGWPGLMIYLLILISSVITVYRHAQWAPLERAFALAFLGAFMTKNLVGFDTFSSTLLYLSFSAAMMHRMRKSLPADASIQRPLHPAYLAGGLLFAVVAVYALSVKPYLDNQLFARAATPGEGQSQAIQQILVLPASELVYGQNTKLMVMDRLLHEKQGESSVLDAKQQEQLFRQAGVLVSNELARQPRNARISYNGAMLLAYMGQYELSLKLMKPLLARSPQRTVFWNKLGRIYQGSGNHKMAAIAFEQQKKLNSEWGKR